MIDTTMIENAANLAESTSNIFFPQQTVFIHRHMDDQ
jgi:hypothetical protein